MSPVPRSSFPSLMSLFNICLKGQFPNCLLALRHTKKERKTCNPHFNYFASPYTLKLSTHTHTLIHTYTCYLLCFSLYPFGLFLSWKVFPGAFWQYHFHSQFQFSIRFALLALIHSRTWRSHTHTWNIVSFMCCQLTTFAKYLIALLFSCILQFCFP